MVIEILGGPFIIVGSMVPWGNQLILDFYVCHFFEYRGGLILHAMVSRFETPALEVCILVSEGTYNLLVTYFLIG